MYIIFGILGGLIGLTTSKGSGIFLWIVVGILIAEVLVQRGKIATLEKAFRPLPSRLPDEAVPMPASAEVEAPGGFQRKEDVSEMEQFPVDILETPEALPSEPSLAKQVEPCDTQSVRMFTGLGDGASKLSSMITRFFTGGNLVLKLGVIIIFFGVAFLLKYAAQRNLVPIEFRLIGVALGGFGLLGGGWLLRRRISGYGLVLQGGGIGILYLVVYAAAKLYHLLPVSLSFAVMVALVVCSSLLAVLQESKSLAIAGIVSGFLAPVLMSTGGGSHVMLFSYYSLLNLGILGISWFKSWRELNLLGFFFTFAIATVWGNTAYQPAHFVSTEPFLVFFFLLYVTVSVLFAHRQPVNLKGYIDGPLVFGLPLIVSALQYFLVRDFEYGMAMSTLALGLFYACLATMLWHRVGEGMRMLTEAFLALGVVFGSMAVPLAVDGQWTSATWALEGAGMIWVGVRQQRLPARLFALLLQIGAAVFFFDKGWFPVAAMAFVNRFFLGALIIALSALFSSWYLDRHLDQLRNWERYFPLPLLVWGVLWWYFGGFYEVQRQFSARDFSSILLLFCSISTMLMTIIALRISWRHLVLAQLIFLPATIIIVSFGFMNLGRNSHLLAGWGAVAWPVALFTGYRLLYLAEDEWPKRFSGLWHPGTLWVFLFLISHEASWLVRQILPKTWQMVCWGLVPAAAVFCLSRWGRLLRWPCGKYIEAYCGIGCVIPGTCILFWNLSCLVLSGNPKPLPYIPLLNPLELSQFLTLSVLYYWAWEARRQSWELPAFFSSVFWLLAGIGFLVLNSVVARCVHVFAGIPYIFPSLFQSAVFQAALSTLWGVSSLVITVWSARNRNRTTWCVGAALLSMVVVKLFLIDLSGTGTIARIISFLVVGGLMLVIGYFSPMPPKKQEENK
jgi:uncharacterized membrane protein